MDQHSESGPEKVINLNAQRLSEPTIVWVETCSNGTRRIGEEVTRFVTDCARTNIETWIAMSTNPSKALELHQRWLSETVRNCTDESHRLMEISSSVMHDFLSRIEQHPAAE